MKRKGEPVRRSVSISVSLLMLTLSVAIPVLERADVGHEPVAESAHDPTACPSAHDHTVCTQASANLSFASQAHHDRSDRVTVREAPSMDAPRAASATFFEGHRSRAPPLA